MNESDARDVLVKADFIGTGRDGSEQSNVLSTPDEQRVMFQNTGAITPPLDPVSLASLYEMSGALRSNIDAYATNVDSFGHRYEPVINFDDPDAFEKVKLAMVQERVLGLGPDGEVLADDVEKVISLLGKEATSETNPQPPDPVDDPGEDLPEPTDDEVKARMASVRRESIRERLYLDKFFSFCTIDGSFESLRTRTRQDLEAIGNAYWEVLRNRADEIVQFNFVPAFTVRLQPQELVAQEVFMRVKATMITPSTEPIRKRFRKFVQVTDGAIRGSNLIWFKEFGDPRMYSSLTGTEYKDENELKRKEPGARPATELVHFKVHCPRSPYGLPRWVSEMVAVIGSRHAEEINLAYFENKSVPPLAILVSGGRLVQDDVTRLENFIKNEIRGKRNFHKIMILQAEGSDTMTPGMSNGRAKIEIKPLTDAQNDDAQFMKYMERNADNIGSVFRLPRMLRGDARDFNRATAQTSLEFTEQQVFGPLRKEFDYFLNRMILPVLGVNFWTFESKGPDFSDPTELLKAVNEAGKVGYLTPEELRNVAARGFGTEFKRIEADWGKRPLQLTLAGITSAQVAPDDSDTNNDAEREAEALRETDENLAEKAEQLIALRKAFDQAVYVESLDAIEDDDAETD